MADIQEYNEHTQFTDNNVTLYLAEIEEMINKLIVENAKSIGDPCAFIAPLPLSSLPVIDWQKGDMALDEHYDPRDGAQTVDEEENFVDERTLRAAYEKEFEKQMLAARQAERYD